MHAQVIMVGLSGIPEEQYQEACGADAQTFANLPGLLAKIWLRDPETNTVRRSVSLGRPGDL
jgi:hypothetical protein